MPVALVTGSSRGIGRAIAERLASDGASVIVNYATDRESADKVVAGIVDNGGQATAKQADVSDPAQLRGLFDATEETYGRLDFLVCNAGIARFSTLADADDEHFDLLFSTNTRSTFVSLREAANRMADGGRIVVISSGAALDAQARTGVYAASKAASDQLVRAAAKELGPRGITVNSVLPGATYTDNLAAAMSTKEMEATIGHTSLGRLGEPADIADVVAFLTSRDARWVTGHLLHAGGGLF